MQFLQGSVLFSGKIYTVENIFTRPPVVTNFMSDLIFVICLHQHIMRPKKFTLKSACVNVQNHKLCVNLHTCIRLHTVCSVNMEKSPLLEQFYNSMCVEKQGFFRVNMENSPYLQFYNSVAGDFYQVCSPTHPRVKWGTWRWRYMGSLNKLIWKHIIKSLELCI